MKRFIEWYRKNQEWNNGEYERIYRKTVWVMVILCGVLFPEMFINDKQIMKLLLAVTMWPWFLNLGVQYTVIYLDWKEAKREQTEANV